MPKLTLYVNDDLFERIQEYRDKLQLSQVFAEAVEKAIASLELGQQPAHLDRGEKEFMEIFRHFGVSAGECILENNIQGVCTRYMSPPAIRKIDEILGSLESKKFIEKKQGAFDMMTVFLLEAGERYLYGKY